MTLRRVVREFVERRLPLGAMVYRSVRDQLATARTPPRRAVEGFLLVADAAVLDGRFEPDERRIAQRLLRDCDVFIDVGANVGLYASLARQAGKKVVAIEPQRANVDRLLCSAEANGWGDIEVWPVGVADQPGILTLYGGSTGASLVAGWSAISEAYRQRIPVTTLDTIVGSRFSGSRIFVKMDIEGAELLALRGAASLVTRTPKPSWLVEITFLENRTDPNPQFAETFELFFDAGYRAFTADAEERPVTRADVRRWVDSGAPSTETHNWLFIE